MQEYKKAFNALNNAQKTAVEDTEGPLLVVAGPGTGKTQLLSTRVAYIIKEGRASAGGILCLTFTDAAAQTMRTRLINLIGEEAYHVSISTYHGFGLEILGRYPQYFSSTIGYSAIDEVSRHQIIEELLKDLPARSLLAAKRPDGSYVWLKAVQDAISRLKQSGLNVDDLIKTIDNNHLVTEKIEKELNSALSGRWQGSNKEKIAQKVQKILPEIAKLAKNQTTVRSFEDLASAMQRSLQLALENEDGIKDWRNKWMLGKDGERRLATSAEEDKLRELATIYKNYQKKLDKRQLYDYEDMIMLVRDELLSNEELRASIQEQYQYILIDEFQDTNDLQMQLIAPLINRLDGLAPNIMAVGDDDQAIYRFQGASSSNLLEYRDSFDDTNTVVLKKNYRSDKEIVAASKHFIEFAKERIADQLKEGKVIEANSQSQGLVGCYQTHDKLSQFNLINRQIKALIKEGTPASEIAVIGRLHRDLEEIIPYLDVPVRYEKRENILNSKIIIELETLLAAVVSLSNNDQNAFSGSLGELIGYEFWGVNSKDLWAFILDEKQKSKPWLMRLFDSENKKIVAIAEVVSEIARQAPTKNTEHLIDMAVGHQEIIKEDGQVITSPLKDYYFPKSKIESNPKEYLDLLSALNKLRQNYRQWRGDKRDSLKDFVSYIGDARNSGVRIFDTSPYQQASSAVNLVTAHGAKGLEFDAVIVLDAVGESWDSRGRGRLKIKWPPNLPIDLPGDRPSDRARLFYVAASRARHTLLIHSYERLDSDKLATPLRYLSKINDQKPASLEPKKHSEDEKHSLSTPRLPLSPAQTNQRLSADLKTLLQARLENYALSPTDLNAFVDVSSGGPKNFLFNNLLRFPSAKTTSMSFGTAVHSALAKAHLTENIDEQIVQVFFENALQREQISADEFKKELAHGKRILKHYFKGRGAKFFSGHRVEVPFKREGSVIGSARITGQIDQLSLIKGGWEKGGELLVVDWKTGRPRSDWKRLSSDITLYKSRQQILFYKLLLEKSKTYTGKFRVTSGALDYIEAGQDKAADLEVEFDEKELLQLEKLIEAVWAKIMSLDFIDTSKYKPSVKGIEDFIQDLVV